MAALVASLSRSPQERSETTRQPDPGPPTARAAPTSEPPPEPLTFEAGENDAQRLVAGRPATLEVSVDEPGSVEIPALGLSAAADSLTPARFEVLPASAGEFEIVFTPAADDVEEPAGRLVVRSAG